MVLSFIKEVLFPLFCISCNTEGSFLCGSCMSSVCANVHVKEDCINNIYKRYASCSVQDRLMAQIIHAVKYEYVEDAWKAVERICLGSNVSAALSHIDLIVPVPLHPRRFAERGYNQSERIANILSKQSRIPVVHALKRVVYTKQQALLGKEEREHNLAAAFASQEPIPEGSSILLVDDVYTTGATVGACIEVLEKACRGGDIAVYTLAQG